MCVLPGDELLELSGLASDGRHWFAVNDGGEQTEVVVLNRRCEIERAITGDIDPYDVEDLALAADGTLWLADTGDNGKDRDTVALIRLTQDGAATLYRLTYPDGQHDTEALLLGRSGRPLLVTKNLLGESEVYRPAGRLTSPGPTRLEKVANLTFHATGTPGGPEEAGSVGSMLVTGGAVSHDGKVVALRTYTDAYLYPAPDRDVRKALARTPVRVPLPREQQGEAIAFEPNGTLLSASEGSQQAIRAVPRATAKVDVTPTTPAADSSPATGDESRTTPLAALAVAAGAAALLWFGLGRWFRRRSR